MTTIAELEARIMRIEDIEAIKMLKAKYWCSVDGKKWEQLAACFTADGVAIYGPNRLEGGPAIIEFFTERSNSGKASVVGIHQGHNPEIVFSDNSTARGTWQLFNYRIDRQENMATRNISYYDDEYARVGDQWLIKSTKTNTIMNEVFSLKNISVTF